VQVSGQKRRVITPFDPSSKSAIQSRVATQSSHGLEGPLVKQTDVSKALARGIIKGNFFEACWPRSVTRGWAHWSPDQGKPPPLTFSFEGKLPGDFLMTVQDATRAESRPKYW